MLYKESWYMELNLLESESLYLSSTINVQEYILTAVVPKDITSKDSNTVHIGTQDNRT